MSSLTSANASVAASGRQVCIDANVVAHALGTQIAPRLAQTIAQWIDSGYEFHVPSLWRYEVTNALYRAAGSGPVDGSTVREGLNLMWALPLTYHDEITLHERAATIALSLKSGAAYDAHYLALTERLAIPFYTCDARLYNAARHRFPSMELVPIA